MKKALILKEMDQLLSTIQNQQNLLKSNSGRISINDIEMELKQILKLYEQLLKLKIIIEIGETPDPHVNLAIDQMIFMETEKVEQNIITDDKNEIVQISASAKEKVNPESEKKEAVNIIHENKRAEIFLDHINVESAKPSDNQTISAKTETPSKKPRKLTGELFDETTTVAQSYTGKTTLHDKMSEGKMVRSVATHLQSKPLTDLKKSIGINERFVFVNELYNGDQKLYNQSIEQLNNFSDYGEARNFLFDELALTMNWDKESKIFAELSELIRRRFNG